MQLVSFWMRRRIIERLYLIILNVIMFFDVFQIQGYFLLFPLFTSFMWDQLYMPIYCIYVALFWSFDYSKRFYNTSRLSPIHTGSHTNGGVQSTIRIPYTNIYTPVAQPSGGIWGSASCPVTLSHADQRSANLAISRRPSLPPELQPPHAFTVFTVLIVSKQHLELSRQYVGIRILFKLA